MPDELTDLVITALLVCDAALTYGIYMDYRAQKAAGKVKTFGEYFSQKILF